MIKEKLIRKISKRKNKNKNEMLGFLKKRGRFSNEDNWGLKMGKVNNTNSFPLFLQLFHYEIIFYFLFHNNTFPFLKNKTQKFYLLEFSYQKTFKKISRKTHFF